MTPAKHWTETNPSDPPNITGTIRHYRCERCGHTNEIKWTGFVPVRLLRQAVMSVMQLDMLRRLHEERTALKQRVRELEARQEARHGGAKKKPENAS